MRLRIWELTPQASEEETKAAMSPAGAGAAVVAAAN
jgi:hypothetical protein